MQPRIYKHDVVSEAPVGMQNTEQNEEHMDTNPGVAPGRAGGLQPPVGGI